MAQTAVDVHILDHGIFDGFAVAVEPIVVFMYIFSSSVIQGSVSGLLRIIASHTMYQIQPMRRNFADDWYILLLSKCLTNNTKNVKYPFPAKFVANYS